MDIIRRVLIRGQVQGVGFRAWTEVTALELGLQGWVRNRRDGAVEALFAGPEAAVAAMIAACGEGPSASQVTAVDQREGTREESALLRPGDLFSVLASV